MIVFDIDGVLADVRHRLPLIATRPKQWDAFFAAADADEPLAHGLAAAIEAATSSGICYITGRPEANRALTSRWLSRHHFPHGPLHMRRAADRRPGAQIKSELLALLGGPDTVERVYDDDPDVVARLRAEGYRIEHVTWMGADRVDQGTLFDAQEHFGRT
ncbi:MAG: hypothetical protein EB027_01530 [Actinobacteria bacterium]|nr:hypothetical protein [Actinomycetota bacterium]